MEYRTVLPRISRFRLGSVSLGGSEPRSKQALLNQWLDRSIVSIIAIETRLTIDWPLNFSFEGYLIAFNELTNESIFDFIVLILSNHCTKVKISFIKLNLKNFSIDQSIRTYIYIYHSCARVLRVVLSSRTLTKIQVIEGRSVKNGG